MRTVCPKSRPELSRRPFWSIIGTNVRISFRSVRRRRMIHGVASFVSNSGTRALCTAVFRSGVRAPGIAGKIRSGNRGSVCAPGIAGKIRSSGRARVFAAGHGLGRIRAPASGFACRKRAGVCASAFPGFGLCLPAASADRRRRPDHLPRPCRRDQRTVRPGGWRGRRQDSRLLLSPPRSPDLRTRPDSGVRTGAAGVEPAWLMRRSGGNGRRRRRHPGRNNGCRRCRRPKESRHPDGSRRYRRPGKSMHRIRHPGRSVRRRRDRRCG